MFLPTLLFVGQRPKLVVKCLFALIMTLIVQWFFHKSSIFFAFAIHIFFLFRLPAESLASILAKKNTLKIIPRIISKNKIVWNYPGSFPKKENWIYLEVNEILNFRPKTLLLYFEKEILLDTQTPIKNIHSDIRLLYL